jgi:hypothetical protein
MGWNLALIMVNGGQRQLLLLFFEPLSQVFIGWAIFFTIIRLKSRILIVAMKNLVVE